MYCNLAYSLRSARRISGRRFSPSEKYFSEGEKRRPEMRLALRRLSCLQSKRKGFTGKKRSPKVDMTLEKGIK